MISCKEYVVIKKEELKENIKTFKRPPKLCVIQVGDNPASNSYIRGKGRDCEEVGIEFEHVKRKEDISQNQLEALVDIKSKDKTIDGLIVQLPLPKHINVERITNLIPPNKDVDGFRRDSCFNACTPKGVIDWLEYNEINLEGKVCTVLGRSKIVGKPLTNMLIDRGATVISCNSKTSEADIMTSFEYSDIIISAIGKLHHWKKWYFLETSKPLILIDIGINYDENGKQCGDFNNDCITACKKGSYITPPKGGTGLLTRLSLVQNTVESYKLNNGGI